MAKNEIAWDLSEIYPSVEDPKVSKTLSKLKKQAKDLSKKYRGKIKDFSAKDLKKMIEKLEDFYKELRSVNLFSSLSYSANMTLPETQQLYNMSQEASTSIGKDLAFVSVELSNLLDQKPSLIKAKELKNYRHYLEQIKRRAPHVLSEKAEQIILEKDRFGVDAWQQLQSSWLNTRTFEVEVEGKKKELNYGEANSLLTHPDRTTRTSANKSIYGLLHEEGELYASALRNICGDWMQVCERRNYSEPMAASLIANDSQKETIEAVLQAVEDHIPLYHRYLKMKTEMMDLPKMGCEDIVAPLPNAPDMEFKWKEAKELVTRAYTGFDEDYAHAVKDMFARNHLDASPRRGKRNGAFCAKWFEGQSAFILLTFTGALREVYTLAHELGHATHDYYMTKEQTLFNTSTAMVVAETASIFGELLLTDLLLKEAKSDEEKQVILTRVLDGAGQAIFQVTSRAWFEQSLYDKIEDGKYLDFKTIAKHWMKARDKVYGGVVDWYNVMDSEWCMKPHYFMSNFRFYNYPYTYAQLFVYALYRKYKEEGKSFIPKFKKILSAGSSLSPQEIGEIVDVDITDPDFWKLGMKQYEYFVNELEKIV